MLDEETFSCRSLGPWFGQERFTWYGHICQYPLHVDIQERSKQKNDPLKEIYGPWKSLIAVYDSDDVVATEVMGGDDGDDLP